MSVPAPMVKAATRLRVCPLTVVNLPTTNKVVPSGESVMVSMVPLKLGAIVVTITPVVTL